MDPKLGVLSWRDSKMIMLLFILVSRRTGPADAAMGRRAAKNLKNSIFIEGVK